MSGADEEAALSPKNRLKFLCSYGGKILPRPSDGQLKYVGGETRAVSVPRSITFSELKEKIKRMCNNAEIVMKYQIMPEDLDTLVSVRSDEDLHYMLEEYDRHDNQPPSPSSSTRFRIFLFPSSTAATAAPSPSYVDAINGSIGISIPNRPPIFTVSSSSACTSPTSTIEYSAATAVNGFGFTGGRSNVLGGGGMHRVRSTPNLSGSSSQLGNSGVGSPRGHQQQQQQQQKATGLTRMGGSNRYEMCGWAGGCLNSGHQTQRRYFNSPSGASGGCGRHGHVDESPAPRSGQNLYFGVPPPFAPRRSIWE